MTESLTEAIRLDPSEYNMVKKEAHLKAKTHLGLHTNNPYVTVYVFISQYTNEIDLFEAPQPLAAHSKGFGVYI